MGSKFSNLLLKTTVYLRAPVNMDALLREYLCKVLRI